MASVAHVLVVAAFVLLSPAPALSYVNHDGQLHQDAEAEELNSGYRTHIVLVKPPADAAGDGVLVAHRRWHESFLPTSRTDSGEPRLVHSYTEALSGFAARLTDGELDAVSKKPGFVRAFPDRTLRLMTTHTPEFLGLRQGPGFWRDVAGLLDAGIYGAHPSFADHGVAPPPAKWKGSCQQGSSSRCNNKLVGVRSLVGDDCRDDFGHGTHTSSTAAGNFVAGAHVNPPKATDPGLVYDLSAADYAGYICAVLGDAALAVVARNASLTCAKLPRTTEAELNYPTITVPLRPAPVTVSRTVTNVGPPAKVDTPTTMTVRVSPGTLVFGKAGEKKTFSVTVSGHGAGVLQGSLTWVSGKHVVRSPIVAVRRHLGGIPRRWSSACAHA